MMIVTNDIAVLDVAFSSDGKRIFSVSADLHVKIWDATKHQPVSDDTEVR